KKELADLDAKLAQSRQELDKAKQEEQDWVHLFEKDKQDKLAEIYAWAGRYAFLNVNDDILKQTSRDIYTLYEPVSFEQIRNRFVKTSNSYQMKLNEDIAINKSHIKALDTAIQEKEAEREKWKKARDPEPPFQQVATRDARRALAETGAVFVPF